MKRILCFVLILSLFFTGRAWAAGPAAALTVSAPCAVLMEKETGEVLFEKNAHQPGFPVIRVGRKALINKDMLLAWMAEQSAPKGE